MQTLFLPSRLHPYFHQELLAARAAYARRDAADAFHHLERAHVLGQRWAVSHTHVHLLMLAHGLRTLNPREILGQLPRIVFGFLGSMVGQVPTGNTGGANVKAEQPMPIPEDLQQLLR
ncbi:hypothetical protein GCM10011375_39720 [Hymenobacter qilianensis]|uniref:Uncharacterized protein n=2 Tax=Hymenobacter qilianensis TaxID=1385715 RepID=A0ACB5PX23_9BACT|nr:DUF3703 domain-containing protein [Hymenobacter qilianensis]QNP54449.1 DUF3703 domain-containing protein [Hymenobacter qilianensis]GGF80694.1 hypothetical protein GCM10011375_39720 [Hymenobacter qilianensis]